MKAFGADETLRNRDDLTPAEMMEVAETEQMLEQTLACMSGSIWIDETRGRQLYDTLRRRTPRIYNPAIVRVFLRYEQRRLVCLAVKVGMPGSEEGLALMLNGHGTKEIAVDFLNSGSAVLADAATRCAAAHGYRIYYTAGHTGARWGRF